MEIISIYGALNAKLRAIESQLFSLTNYKDLSTLKTVDEVTLKIKEKSSYSNVLGDIDINSMHRGFIEERLDFSLVSDFERIYNFIPSYDLKKYLNIYYLKNELEILKYFLTMIYDKRTEYNSFNEKMIAQLGKIISIDKQKLRLAKDVQEFIDSILEPKLSNYILKDYENSHGLFSIQSKMDIYYYMELHKLQEKYLKGINKKSISIINGTEIDLKNIIWIYRIKSSYISKNESIYAHLIPYNFKISKADIIKMVETVSIEELTNEVKNSYYGKIFEFDKGLEYFFYNTMNKICYKTSLKYQNSLAGISKYIFEKKTEIKNITSLLEGVRYRLNPNDIFNYLMLSEKNEVK